MQALLVLVAFVVVTSAAIDRFGLLHGVAVTCALWLVMPYKTENSRS